MGGSTAGGVILCLVVAIAIVYVQGLGLGVEEIKQAFEQPAAGKLLASSFLSYLLTPYTMYNSFGALLPMVAWAVGGFVGGMIARSPSKAVIMAILCVAIAWVVLGFISGSMAGLSFEQTIRTLVDDVKEMEKNLAVAFVACLAGGIFGGAITKGEKNKKLEGLEKEREEAIKEAEEEKERAEKAIAEKQKVDQALKEAEQKIKTLEEKLKSLKPEERKEAE